MRKKEGKKETNAMRKIAKGAERRISRETRAKKLFYAVKDKIKPRDKKVLAA
jgi:hypothetical protein